jgi:predicted nucleotidyltransferase
MSRKETILDMLSSHADSLRRMGVAAIGIFGSVVRGEDTVSSDVDILVEFEKKGNTFRNFNALCDFLDGYLGNNYDLVTRNSLSPYMGPHILDEVEYAVFS